MTLVKKLRIILFIAVFAKVTSGHAMAPVNNCFTRKAPRIFNRLPGAPTAMGTSSSSAFRSTVTLHNQRCYGALGERLGISLLRQNLRESLLPFICTLMPSYAAQQRIRDDELLKAIENDRREEMYTLLDEGASINAVNKHNMTALLIAIHFNYTEIVEALLKKKVRVDGGGEGQLNPLLYASLWGHAHIVQQLLDHQACVDKRSVQGATPLLLACIQGHTETAHVLLDCNANSNAVDKAGVTPLMAATYAGDISTVQKLLDKGARVNEANKNGCTPLMIADHCGHSRIREILVAANASCPGDAYTGVGMPQSIILPISQELAFLPLRQVRVMRQ